MSKRFSTSKMLRVLLRVHLICAGSLKMSGGLDGNRKQTYCYLMGMMGGQRGCLVKTKASRTTGARGINFLASSNKYQKASIQQKSLARSCKEELISIMLH